MQVINLDLSVKGIIPLLQAKQGDVGRKFQAVITDGGTAYDIPSGTTLSVWYSGTSGEGNYTAIDKRSAFTISGNTVTVELVAQMLTCAGGGTLSLVMNGADGTQIATWNIPYMVEKIPGANSEKATRYYTAFSEAVMGLNAAIKGYTLTAADKAEIAEMVEGATVVQAPLYVDDTTKMTDTSRVYILNSTGHIWAHMNTTVEQEVTVTDRIEATTENPCQIGRLSSSGTVSDDVQTHVVSPYIDLTKAEYQGKTIQIHLEGNRYATETTETYIMSGQYDENKNTIHARIYMNVNGDMCGEYRNAGLKIEVLGENSSVMTIPVPLVHNSGKTISYMRFCGKGTVEASNIYITYQDIQTVAGDQWVDTGMTYSHVLTDEEKQIMVNEVAELVDAQLLSLLGDGVVTS